MRHNSENKSLNVDAMVINGKCAVGGEGGPQSQPQEVREGFWRRGKTSGRGYPEEKTRWCSFIYSLTLCEVPF